MNAIASPETDRPTESVFRASADLPADAIRRSLEALLKTRHHAIPKHRFTVLDTFDGRVRRAGACLTRDSNHGPTTVSWQTSVGGGKVAARLDRPASFAWDFPKGPLQQRVASVIGPRRLLAQADAEEYGSLLDVLDERGKTVARLRIASGQAKLPVPTAAWQPLPTLITLTALRGYEDAYRRLVPVLESRPGLEHCSEGRLAVLLGHVGASPCADVSLPAVELTPAVRADAGAREIHLALLRILEANEPGLRADVDTEFLHDFRVAVRRTRSLLGQVRHVFPSKAVQHFSTEFSWLGRLTGPPRDLDVLLLALRRGDELADVHREPLIAALSAIQRQEHDRLIEALDGARYRALLSEWRSFLEERVVPEPDAVNAGAPLADVVSRRAWRLSRRIARKAEVLCAGTPADDIHAIRIDAKKLRYLIDVTPGFRDDADLAFVLKALKALQRVLGDFNDADVQERRLLEYGSAIGAGAPPDVFMTLGRMSERRRHRRDALRQEVIEALSAFRARDTMAVCRRAFKRPHPAAAT